MDFSNIIDLTSLLPAEASEKLHQLRRNRGDANSVMRGLVERGMEARATRQDAEQRLRMAKRPPSGRPAGEDHPEVIDAQRALDAALAEQARLSQHEAVISATFHVRGRLVDKIERFLRDAASRGLAFVPAVAVEPKVAKNESVIDAIERVRRQGRTIAADMHTVASAPVPSADAKRRMREQIEAIASMGRPNVAALIEDPAGKIAFAEISRQTLARGSAAAYVGWQEENALAFSLWLHKDAALKALDALIMEEASDDVALSEADRARKMRELERDAELVARQLAALIWFARADGLTVEHDDDADPAAVLGIVLAIRAPEPAVEHADEIVRQRRAVVEAGADAQALTKAIAASMPS